MKTWNLISSDENPQGYPIPETTKIVDMEKEYPPSGDAVCTGDAIVFPDGTILLSHKRFHSSLPGRDKGRRYKSGTPSEVRRSRDNGYTWEFLGAIDPDPEGNDMTVSLLRPDGSPDNFVRAFIERSGQFFTYCSHDGGETWIDKRLLFDYDDPEKILHLTHPFNGLKKLADGTVLMPMQRWGSGSTFYPPVLARCLPIDDPIDMGSLREHWEIIEVGYDVPECCTRSPAAIISESDVVQRSDGSLLWIMRSSCGWMFICESFDNGNTWSRLHRDNVFGCTNSKHHLLKLADGTILMSHHNANNTQRNPFHKRTPLAVAVSRDGGFSWERSVSVAWKSNWHYGYPKGLELPDGDILYFARYSDNHDSRSISATRVKREFLDTTCVSQDADGGYFEDGIFHITGPDAKLTAVNRQELNFPVEAELEFVVDKLDGRFQILAITGEGSMEMIALGVNGTDDGIALEVCDFDLRSCSTGWQSLGKSINRGETCHVKLILQNPWQYQIDVNDIIANGHTIKPLIPYATQIGINLTLDDPLRDTKISARVLHWNFSSGEEFYSLNNLWSEAHPCYRFITTHFAYDENGLFHGSVPRIGVDLSIPQGNWGNMDVRNPALIETNVGGTGDGVLFVDKPLRSTEGTVAFWGLPLTAGNQTEVLLDCGDFQLGFIGGEKIRPFLRLKDRIIEGDELKKTTGLYVWQWRFTDKELKSDFAHVVDGNFEEAGGGSMAKILWQESLPSWFNNGEGSAPFRARITTLGIWQRTLTKGELCKLGRW